MSTQEVCRLCLSEDNLMCVFDKRLEKTDHMKEVILVTTGVEIHSKDVITQKICTKCGQDAIKMFQFRQQSLKNDRYLKAQCRELLKHTDLKIPNTNVTIKTEKIDKEEIKQEPVRKPPYKVHPTMTALSRKYPQVQFPAVSLLYNVDPCISMEMDTVENYFKNRNLNMRKYVQLALRASTEVSHKKISTVTKSLVQITGNSVNNRTTDHIAQITAETSKTVGNAEVVDKISPINIKLNQTGYAIVRPLTESIVHDVVNNTESTSSCRKLMTGCPDSLSGTSESKKRRHSDTDFLSEPETKKVILAKPSNSMPVQSKKVILANSPISTPVQLSVEKILPPVFKCNICSSVEFSAKHLLKKHQIEHSRCSFCKIQFKSVGMKQQHTNNSCFVKEVLNNMPDVEVERIELNRNVRLHHQNAFANFPPLPGLEKTCSASESSKTAEEFIEIISDDEDTSASKENLVSPSNNSARTISTVTKTLHENPPLSLVIKPDVRMKNDNVLDSLKTQTPDIGIVRELLTKFRKLQSATDEESQTELPTTESIRMKKGCLNAELINLKQMLHSYQIPVKVRKGPISAIYNYNYHPTTPRPKILKFWNDLTPIDVKKENKPVSDLVIDIPETRSDSIIRDANSINKSKSCDFFNKDEMALQKIENFLPTSLNDFASSSDSSQRKSPTTSTQVKLPISNSTVAQAESLASISTQSSMLDSPHLNSLEMLPVRTSSGDILIRRHSPNSFGTDPTIHHINNPLLQIYPVQATPSIPINPSGQNFSVVDQITLQNNAYINSESRRKSPVQNKSDLKFIWNSLNTQSEALDCTTKTRQELANKVIDLVFNKSTESVDTGTINVRPPNGLIYSNNKQQPHPRIKKLPKPKKKIERVQKVRHVPATTNSGTNGQGSYENAPIQKTASNDNNLFIKPPPPYPNGSTPVNQMTQPYSSPYVNTSNVPHSAETPQSGYFNAFHQYISQLQEFRSFQTMGKTAGTHFPNAPLNNMAHHDATSHFTAANSLGSLSMLQVPDPFSYNGTESPTFPHYSKANEYISASVINTVNQNCNFSNRKSPNTNCTNSFTPAGCGSLTDSVPPSDKINHFASGMIRVRNVSELT